MSPSRIMLEISNNWKLIIFGSLLWLVIMMAYSWVLNNDNDDDDSVTFSFQCASVLANRASYPAEVVDACNKLRSQ